MRLHAQLLHFLQFIDTQQIPCMVPETGLEPALVSQPDPKSGASTNSATPAYLKMNELRGVLLVQS